MNFGGDKPETRLPPRIPLDDLTTCHTMGYEYGIRKGIGAQNPIPPLRRPLEGAAFSANTATSDVLAALSTSPDCVKRHGWQNIALATRDREPQPEEGLRGEEVKRALARGEERDSLVVFLNNQPPYAKTETTYVPSQVWSRLCSICRS